MTALRPVRLLDGRISFRLHARTLWVCGLLLVVIAAGLVTAMMVGDYHVPLDDALRAVFGESTRMAELFVERRRLPRALTGVMVGIAMGVAGAVFQSLTRNPLGSPDIVGFGHGAATGAVVVLLLFGGGTTQTAIGAFAGGLVSAAAVYLLALKGGAHGYRLVLVGIGVSAILIAFNNYLVTRADLNDARAATVWIVGSLYERRWPEATLMAVGLLVLLPIVLALSRTLSALDIGDEGATSLGVRVERSRLALIVSAVGLTAVATACAGPVAFVSLVAPQVARRLTRSAGPGLLPAGLLGGALLLVSDIVAQRITSPGELPVGVVTGAVGGAYLGWLLLREWRAGRG
ncbi:iron chelate uptake ABC transporter family permease subunit [Actinosynnema sp. NPDC047251]|uniref:ABC-type iron-siderophore transporter, permease subunit n=1 Tax=Saccharothrix espanaensis (strain ATCC 51144 / DSM 44229 / JCM 9112 / NBRC 15066 / NRRL 15764) TaxID=1179773 RepID=K0JR30_SACES|nr:iron chelate uptake ABC transporter family permease subunit [Saccharothrix espanaensis]CCH30010.1 ABC-type iron-siderophore transporter, permease subunit [Saccharothrix espanaensis DSM 44229]